MKAKAGVWLWILWTTTLMIVVSSQTFISTVTVGQTPPIPLLTEQEADTGHLSEFTVNGRLESKDQKLKKINLPRGERYFDEYTFKGKDIDQITIDLSSSEFDPYLFIAYPEPFICVPDPWGGVLCSGGGYLFPDKDNNSGIGKNARIIMSFASFLAGLQGKYRPASYKIIVTSNQPGETGSYRLSVRKTTPTDLKWAEAEKLDREVIKLKEKGKYFAATPLAERSLEIRQKILEPEHLDVASSLQNLAELYSTKGDYRKAESLFQQALNIREKKLESEDPEMASTHYGMAELYSAKGDYRQAESLFWQALEIRKKKLGEEHPKVASSLHGLAELYQVKGEYRKGEALFKQALNIRKKKLGEEHPKVAMSLNSLAKLYQAQRKYSEAEPLLQRAGKIQKKRLGSKHPEVASSLHNLGEFYSAQGDYRQAEPLFERALNIREEMLGVESSEVASSLHSLAELYSIQGDYRQAEPLFERALNIRQKMLEPEHPEVAKSFHSLAKLYLAQGNIDRAIEFETIATDIDEKNLALILATGSEVEKLAYMATLFRTTNSTISLHLQSAREHPEAVRLSLTTVLRRKGRILDAVTNSWQTLRQKLRTEDQTRLDQLANIRSQLAKLLFQGWGAEGKSHRRVIAKLQAEAEQIEVTLAQRSAQFRSQIQPVTLKKIQSLIPQDTVLVEVVWYLPFNPQAQLGEQWNPPRYAAYVLHPNGEPKWTDLGAAAPIDEAVVNFRDAIVNRMPISELKKLARQLDKQLMKPIRPLLGNAHRLLLSADGALNLLPWETLVDEQQQYQIDRFAFTYLNTGKDLLRLQTSVSNRQAALVMANPHYNNTGYFISQKNSAWRGSRNSRSIDLAQLYYESLPGTTAEAEAIQALLPDAQVLLGARATETELKQVRAPEFLHIATHGFFLADQEVELRQPLSKEDIWSLPQRRTFKIENPLLRSGLALAGFNPRRNGIEDGVLTALEVAGLDLWGTQLVVLSACETGLGDVKNGEGVYGLRRALVIAGSQSQVISLWKVSDEATKELMVNYYQRLLAGEGREEGLRQAKLDIQRATEYEHPYYWASFISLGDWRPLQDN